MNYSDELIEMVKEALPDIWNCTCKQKLGTPMYELWFDVTEYTAEMDAKIKMGLISYRMPISLSNWKVVSANEDVQVTLKLADFSGGWEMEE